jgi:CubicO group peptidase (beta-lactamase class C family)
VASAAPESGAGDPTTKSWDWNSDYWRELGAPWGTAHGSVGDVAIFLDEFLHPSGKALKAETAKMMVANHNKEGLRPRGLGFDIGANAGSPGCSERTFGHTGSTGTRCWADPESDTICVILTTLPARALTPHPRDIASAIVAQAVG